MTQYAEAVKEFTARLGDELLIRPGDIIEVISDDREFNDGWYMGKNVATNEAGLYPKSFTKPAPPPDLRRKQSDTALLRLRLRNRTLMTLPLNLPLALPSGARLSVLLKVLLPQNNGLPSKGSHQSVVATMTEIDQALEEFSPAFASRPLAEWDPADVADYFSLLNYHAEGQQFQKHKITGAILVELELAYLKELDIGPFGTRFEIYKIIEDLKHGGGHPIYRSLYRAQSQPQIASLNQQPSNRVSGTGIMLNATNQAYQNTPQAVTEDPQEQYTPKPTAGEYEYTMDNPYLNASTDNLEHPFAPLNEQINLSNSPPARYLLTSEEPEEQIQSHDFQRQESLHEPQLQYTSVLPEKQFTSDRQFSPVRKAPLPPTEQQPPRPQDLSILTPLTPSTNKYTGGKNFPGFSAGSRLPDLPITQTQEDIARMGLSEQQSESQKLPKFRLASANDASLTKLPVQMLQNAKRAVSSAMDLDKSRLTPPLDEPVLGENSGFRVTQVRNAQTLRVMKKTKKQTLAFQEGINQITPEMAAKTADYSGWMSKKLSLAVGPWKQRFFTLHGTRLSYFGSMKDTREKGLIDITAHRVLPARDDDKLVSLYAATTGQGRFCFKLMPPAPGLKKGLTFTQPKVHYFAVETREEMRSWMSALMKATIDLDDTVPTVSTCLTPTVSLQKAQELLSKARENAKAREEQLKSKGFLQTGVNPNAVEKMGSPSLEINGSEGILGSISENGAALSPADTSSTNSGLVSNHLNSNTLNNTSNGPKIDFSPKGDDRKVFSRFKNK